MLFWHPQPAFVRGIVYSSPQNGCRSPKLHIPIQHLSKAGEEIALSTGPFLTARNSFVEHSYLTLPQALWALEQWGYHDWFEVARPPLGHPAAAYLNIAEERRDQLLVRGAACLIC